MTSAVAIDFGTTRTKLAYRPEGSRPELMRFEHDRPYAPSLFSPLDEPRQKKLTHAS